MNIVESPAPADAPPAAYHAQTVCAAFQETVARCAPRIALRSHGRDDDLTWGEYGERVAALAGGLAALGLSKGTTLAIMLGNRTEFHLVDMAAVHLGAIPFSLYNTSSPTQIDERLRTADCRLLVTEQAFMPVVREASKIYGRLDHVIVVDAEAGSHLTLEEVEARADEGFDFDARWRGVEADDILTMIFTSGTTGPPKAAQLSHRGVLAVLRNLDQVVPLPRENVISFMPMAHVAERLWSQYMPIAYGACSTACPDRSEVFACLREVRPDHVWLLPRMWEKLKEVIEGQIAASGDDRRAAVTAAIEIGHRRVALEQDGKSLPEELVREADEARSLLRSEFIVPLGLDRATATGIGGAPCPRPLVEFFNALGVPLFEGYGLTEATGFGAIFSDPKRFRIGTIGRPLPGVEIKLAGDGELLMRSEMNMVGYRNDPEGTRQAIDEEGWLHTGDIADIDDQGYVSIIDRKKDLIVNSYGKNMSPVSIESTVKQETPLISQIVAVGDGRPYNVALVTLDVAAAMAFAKQQQLAVSEPHHLVGEQAVIDEVAQAIERANARLSRVEQIRKFKLLAADWPPDSDELTPTMKLKRKPIAGKYAAEIEQLYSS
jgi:long-subunit acyl-CoA synthetase (AMP-forming)